MGTFRMFSKMYCCSHNSTYVYNLLKCFLLGQKKSNVVDLSSQFASGGEFGGIRKSFEEITLV
jgi:hypothetical protein